MTTTKNTRRAEIGMTVCYWTTTDRCVNTGTLVRLTGEVATIQIHADSPDTITRRLSEITSFRDEALIAA